MRTVILFFGFLFFSSFVTINNSKFSPITENEVCYGSSFSLINDTKDKVSIHTGTGFVSLNKGSKTSIGCNIGKEVSWADSGKKKEVIFKITKDMCGKTIRLSDYMK